MAFVSILKDLGEAILLKKLRANRHSSFTQAILTLNLDA